jgi:DNA-binding beta-propeller fold protein YncE
MPEFLRTVGWSIDRTRRFALMLTLFMAPDFTRVAVAATFQGTFTEPTLCSPRGVALSPSGDVFVGSDCTSGHMAHFTATGTLIDTWVLSAGIISANPNGVAVDGSGVIFVTDTDHNRIRKYTSTGFLFSSFVTAFQPVDVALNGANEVFVAALGGTQVQKFTNSGALLMSIGSAGSGPGQFYAPQGIGLDASGRIYVADYDGRISRFLADGTFDMEFRTGVTPSDVAVGPDGNIYVVGYVVDYVSSVYQYSPNGTFQLKFDSPAGLDLAWRIAIGPTGAMYITEQYAHRVSRFQIFVATAATRTTFGRLKAMYR